MEDEHIEHTLYVNRDVKVYRIPPRPAAGGHSSGSWLVSDEIFTGRLRIMAKGDAAEIRLESNTNGELFALCPFTPATQAVAIEPTVDSSRYYVLRVEDPATKRHAFLGVGFSDRGAAFDFNAALADHAKQCQRESLVASHAAAVAGSSASAPAAAAAGGWQDPAIAALYKDPGDLSLKEGQTIRIDVKRPASKSGGGSFLTHAADTGSLRTSNDGTASYSRGSSSGGGGGGGGGGGVAGAAPVLPPQLVLLPPPGQQAPAQALSRQVQSPGAAPAGNSSAGPSVVTVASAEENWATFD